MLKKINRIMHIVMGITFGIYLGKVAFVWIGYRQNPSLYEIQSSPWYAEIVVISIAYGIVLFLEIAIQCLICHKIKKRGS